jgi:hypothetical protein
MARDSDKKVKSPQLVTTPPAPPPSPRSFSEHHYPLTGDPEFLVVSCKHVLCADEINNITQLSNSIGAVEVHDRADTLVYRHEVTRIEIPLRAQHPQLYNKVMGLMRNAGSQYWSEIAQFGATDGFMPEIEYIEYDTARSDEPPVINPHRDNKSIITLIVMLTSPEDFVGGNNFFEPAREFRLDRGQAVLFRGERTMHWISPVTQGRRAILQIELSYGAWTRAVYRASSLLD